MSGLLFSEAQPAAPSTPNRADIVCFIGFVGRRAAPLPARVKSWLQDHGWRPFGTEVADLDPVLGVPVPVESFEAFDQLYAWEKRPPQPHAFPFATWLGAAVRSFFRQGGARCFIVRVGDPAPHALPGAPGVAADKLARLGQLVPGPANPGTIRPSRSDRESWKGLGVMLGLEEAAFACLPDLPELVADAALEPVKLPEPKPGPEVFVDCTPTIVPPEDESRQASSAPACTAAGYLRWRRQLREATLLLQEFRPDTQLVCALPLPSPDLARSYTRHLNLPGNVLGLGDRTDEIEGIATPFLQLCYPWLITPDSESLPGSIEPPDGVLAGVLARTIPELGVAHSIGRQILRGVHGFEPALPGPDFMLDTPRDASPALIHRVSLLGRTPDAIRVLSDVTTSLVQQERPASIRRLAAAIIRTSRQIGFSVTFEPSGPELWQKIRMQLERLLGDFYAAGALHGASAAEAYSIRCDETTTTRNDLDHGRVIAEVRFAPSHPVGLICVVLSLREGSVTTVGSAA